MAVIGAVVPDYPPASLVGAWIATHGFLRHLVDCGHSVAVSRTCGSGAGWELDGVRVLGEHDEFPDVDVLVSHATGPDAALRLADQLGVPHVRIVHGPGSMDPVGADVVVTTSHASAAECFPGAVVCHPSTRPEQHRVEQRGDRITLVNLSKLKGVMTAWRAAERLPAHRFLGVENGYRQQHRPRARNFEVIPAQRDMRTVWSRTRVLLMPSKYETWGMVGVEAMCSGIPVIAHPTPGLRESLGDAGIFVDRADLGGWVDAIRSLDDPAIYAAASAAAAERSAELDPMEGPMVFANLIETLI